MKYVLVLLALLFVVPAHAEEKPLTGADYAKGALNQKEAIIMQLLDELAKTKEELKKYKENSWLP